MSVRFMGGLSRETVRWASDRDDWTRALSPLRAGDTTGFGRSKGLHVDSKHMILMLGESGRKREEKNYELEGTAQLIFRCRISNP